MEIILFSLMFALALSLILGMATQNVSVTYTGEATAGSSRDVDYESAIKTQGDVLAALEGQLTTRTSDTVGTITLATGHGISTADKVDLYWDGGKRYGVVVGTATATTIPITGGTGDVLPAADSTINVGRITEMPFPITGAATNFLVLQTQVAGYIKLVEHSGTTRTVHLVQYVEPGAAYGWDEDNGLANPITGDTITHAHISQSDTGGTISGNKATAGITG